MTDLISRSALLKSYDIAKMVEYDETGCGVTRIAIPVQAIDDAPRRGRCGGGAVQGLRVCVESQDDRNSVLRAPRKLRICCTP